MANPANFGKPIRVRFAPSPTGLLHVGNVRTALFNWLLAKHHGGSFLLRIEDTDAERSKPKYEKRVMDDLRWLGIDWNEGIDRGGDYGPYRQSERYDIYRKFAEQLVENNKAFYCFCSEEELEKVRQLQLAHNATPRYSGKCRHLSPAQAEVNRKKGIPSTLRLRVRPGVVRFNDSVFGRIEIETAQISDPVLMRGDGSPTYNFCCVVDDSLMKISHVVRGDGHLSNTHRQILLYEALGAPIPQFAHLPTLLGPDGQKLSKRHGATSVEEFWRQGYLPQAVANYLALLGRPSPDEGREILSLEAISRRFDLTGVQKNPAIFDSAKLAWMNRNYINASSGESLVDRARCFFSEAGLIPAQPDAAVRSWVARVIDLVKSNIDHLDQLPEQTDIVYGFETNPPRIEPSVIDLLRKPEGQAVVREFARLVEEKESLTVGSYLEIVGQMKATTHQKGRNLLHPIRAALTGRDFGPDLEMLIPLYEEGSRLNLPRKVMSCRERLCAVINAI
jgi:nondiscriminating glutamyl-tRNA synthetase